jgi:uncharacterized protein YdhG (YjbR/CyaY superfamily)
MERECGWEENFGVGGPFMTTRSDSKAVDEYISKAPKGVQRKLQEVRAIIRRTAPSAIEGISYRLPFYDYKGPLAWFGLFKEHIGLYIRPPVIEEHRKALARYKVTKSAVHLPLGEKVPVGLVEELVKARMKKNEAEWEK